ncbi:hypothetical protein, partial [Aliivibrio finisterrensis]|uniref:hypothetical protein n=1 Tax=Aliivibrio finisterrensis TaxID=511998 RepID=UPI001A937E0C
AEPDEMKTKRQQRRNSRLLSRNYESRDSFDEPCKKFRTQYAQHLIIPITFVISTEYIPPPQ